MIRSTASLTVLLLSQVNEAQMQSVLRPLEGKGGEEEEGEGFKNAEHLENVKLCH